jgi:hypothetical protein
LPRSKQTLRIPTSLRPRTARLLYTPRNPRIKPDSVILQTPFTPKLQIHTCSRAQAVPQSCSSTLTSVLCTKMVCSCFFAFSTNTTWSDKQSFVSNPHPISFRLTDYNWVNSGFVSPASVGSMMKDGLLQMRYGLFDLTNVSSRTVLARLADVMLFLWSELLVLIIVSRTRRSEMTENVHLSLEIVMASRDFIWFRMHLVYIASNLVRSGTGKTLKLLCKVTVMA